MVGMLVILGMLRISGMSGQTSTVIPFRNHNFELIRMLMEISGMMGMSEVTGMLGNLLKTQIQMKKR